MFLYVFTDEKEFCLKLSPWDDLRKLVFKESRGKIHS